MALLSSAATAAAAAEKATRLEALKKKGAFGLVLLLRVCLSAGFGIDRLYYFSGKQMSSLSACDDRASLLQPA